MTVLLDEELGKPNPARPELAQYLALTLGSFQTLKAAAIDGRAAEPVATLARALGPEQPTAVRVAAAISLSRQADRVGGSFGDLRAVHALAAAAATADAEVRQRAAYALGYFAGDAPRQALIARVNQDEDRTVQYNAAVALARRGDVEAAPLLREMLSERDLRQTIHRETPSETATALEAVELEALWALQASAPTRPALAQKARNEIEQLAQTGPPNVRVEAQALLKKMPDAP